MPADRVRRGHSSGLIKADTDIVRRQNRALVLSTLRRLSPIARVELGTTTQLSPATITSITADLMAEGLVETVPEPDADLTRRVGPQPAAARGRPRTHLRLRAGAAHVLGIKLSINSAKLMLSDFGGGGVAERAYSLRTLESTRESLPATLIELVRGFLSEHGVAPERLAEIGIASQGFVDVHRGAVVWSPAFSVRNLPLVHPMAEAFGVPCFISNDANMVAEALNWADPVRYGGTFAVIFVDYGVGMGLFTDGKLFFGADGSAAEIGHMNSMPGGPLCRCGRRGCLEAYAADYAIIREARGLPPDTDPALVQPGPGDLLALEEAARSGDRRIQAIYEAAGEALGYALARFMSIVNPSRIVFTGASTRALPLMQASMERAIEAALVADLRGGVVFETLPFDEDRIGTGLMASALMRLDRDVFANPLSAVSA